LLFNEANIIGVLFLKNIQDVIAAAKHFKIMMYDNLA